MNRTQASQFVKNSFSVTRRNARPFGGTWLTIGYTGATGTVHCSERNAKEKISEIFE